MYVQTEAARRACNSITTAVMIEELKRQEAAKYLNALSGQDNPFYFPLLIIRGYITMNEGSSSEQLQT